MACLAHWRRGVAADAHDAGLSGWLGKLNGRVMLMMMACPAGWGKWGAADAHDAHDAGVLGSLEKGCCG